MPFQKGQSGNPVGRTPKARPFANSLIEQAQRNNIECPTFTNQRTLAILIWNGLTSGRVPFGNYFTYELTAREWLDLVKWAHQHIDGVLTTPPEFLIDSSNLDDQPPIPAPEVPLLPPQTVPEPNP